MLTLGGSCVVTSFGCSFLGQHFQLKEDQVMGFTVPIYGPEVPRFSLAHTCRFMKKSRGCEQQQIFFKWTSTFDMCSVSHVPHVVCALPTDYVVLCWNSPGQRQETVFPILVKMD